MNGQGSLLHWGALHQQAYTMIGEFLCHFCFFEERADTMIGQDSLQQWGALLVVHVRRQACSAGLPRALVTRAVGLFPGTFMLPAFPC